MLAEAEAAGVLRIATLPAPNTLYQGADGFAGFEHDLAAAFADHLGLTAEFVTRASVADALAAVDAGEADIAAAGVAVTPERAAARLFTRPYGAVSEVVVCRAALKLPDGPDGAAGAEIVVPEGSSAAEALARAQDWGWSLTWRAEPDLNWPAAVDAVSRGDADCTVLDDHVLALYRRYVPNLDGVALLPGKPKTAWAIAGEGTGRGEDLKRAADRWLARSETRRLLERLEETYHGFRPEEVTVAHAAEFRRAIRTKLPEHRALFEREAARAEIPWTLLAAVAYQESRWDPDAKSPTGVRGMMMLTRDTAAFLKVKDRTDIVQSTRGGARYLRQLHDRLPASIGPRDRWWFAAAAYNMGFGHVLDARKLAAARGGDPDRWADVREALPMLEDPVVSRYLRHGRGNGRQAGVYVRRVRDYADVLQQRFAGDLPETVRVERAAPPEEPSPTR